MEECSERVARTHPAVFSYWDGGDSTPLAMTAEPSGAVALFGKEFLPPDVQAQYPRSIAAGNGSTFPSTSRS